MFTDRPYQKQIVDDAVALMAGGANVLVVLPTGGGKTHVAARIWQERGGGLLKMAHRKELIGQLSAPLCRMGIPHRVIGPKQLVSYIIGMQRAEFGRVYYNPSAPVAVGSVDTLNARGDDDTGLNQFYAQVRTVAVDEGHHLLRDNKWGRAVARMPNAVIAGFTADTRREDGKGLGAHAAGYYDAMVVGPTMRQLIEAGYLCPYKIFAPHAEGFDRSAMQVSASTGEFKKGEAENAVKNSSVVGDLVETKLSRAPRARGIHFLPSLEIASATAERFRAEGTTAEFVSGKTEASLRDDIIRRFRAGEILELVNVDLFGEGFDVPGVEYVGCGRPTMSWQLLKQMFGRMLRLDPTNPHKVALFADHVNNIAFHALRMGALPDTFNAYSLDGLRKRNTNKGGEIPVKECEKCSAVYERFRKACPECGHVPTPAQRGGPEFVDGDLTELDVDALNALLRQVVDLTSGPATPYGADMKIVRARQNQHAELIQAQHSLRQAMQLYGGYRKLAGRTTEEMQREFYITFGVDVLSAQGLNRKDAEALERRVRGKIAEMDRELKNAV